MTLREGSYVVAFYPQSVQTEPVPVQKLPDRDGLIEFLSSIDAMLTEHQIAVLTSAKIVTINNLDPPENILKSYGLI